MKTYNDVFYEFRNELQAIYDEREAAAIAHEVLAHLTGKDKLQRLSDKDMTFTAEQQEQYERIKAEMKEGRPLQYVTGNAWFMGNAYKVNEAVLIPRPETEELVQWIVSDAANNSELHILDIGTGSGCIPIEIKLGLPAAAVTSCDISSAAIEVAKENAAQLNADVKFMELDMTDTAKWQHLEHYDVIVSNPPYIPMDEKAQMHINVAHYEPATALFVPGNDTMYFYRYIADIGKQRLKKGGNVYCELHRDYAMLTRVLFHERGYKDIELRKDMNGHLRMLKATLP